MRSLRAATCFRGCCWRSPKWNAASGFLICRKSFEPFLSPSAIITIPFDPKAVTFFQTQSDDAKWRVQRMVNITSRSVTNSAATGRPQTFSILYTENASFERGISAFAISVTDRSALSAAGLFESLKLWIFMSQDDNREKVSCDRENRLLAIFQ